MHKFLTIILLLLFMTFVLLSLNVSISSAAFNHPVTFSDETNTSPTTTDQAYLTAVPSPTVSDTPHPSPTPTLSPTQSHLGNLHLPIILKAINPTATSTPTVTQTPNPDDQSQRILVCNNLDLDIPDNNPEGAASVISIGDPLFINDLDVRLAIKHSWIGDLKVYITHQETGKTVTLLNRPGFPGETNGCKFPNIIGIMDDDISLPAENECSTSPAAISGIYQPDQNLQTFDGEVLAGNWLLNIADLVQYDTGNLDDWCINALLSNSPNPPTPIPTVDPLPDNAKISDITGHRQSLPLDCESRSAVDWANYFDVSIGELEFFNNLPVSDNPDLGFVGNVYGQWGQIPPNPYGVHAEPIANLLREYGLIAYAHRPFSWDQLRAEIAQGRPVIVWIVGDYNGDYEYVVNGIPEYYTPAEGYPMVVASFEHTVIVTGYTSEDVYYLNGGNIYQKDINQFLESWSVLGNMAISAQP